jgi:hypothetical protein
MVIQIHSSLMVRLMNLLENDTVCEMMLIISPKSNIRGDKIKCRSQKKKRG